MAEPWLTIIGIGEDGTAGLGSASRAALAQAEVVFGGPRHLALVDVGDRGIAWPLPFAIDPVLAHRGRPVVVLASGDPFWFGAGASLAAALNAEEFRCYPAPSTFSLAAARLGWRLETTACFGLHAAPFETLVSALADGARLICLMRDGAAVATLAQWLADRQFGASRVHVLEALGGPRERIRTARADDDAFNDVIAPVALALELVGPGGLPRTSGIPDHHFVHDGQITRQPVRALTLSALAPRTGEVLWDIGAGSGSIAVEWCLAGGHAIAIETRADRAVNVRANADRFGLGPRLDVVEGAAPAALAGLAAPAAVFVGGGASDAVLTALWDLVPGGTRIVANAVTLETEALLVQWSAGRGGTLLRIALSGAEPLGRVRGWVPARPVVQWSVVR